jgi:hypothetical protein
MGLINDGMPPPYYDHRPNVPVIELRLPEGALMRACGAGWVPAGATLEGCSDRRRYSCKIYLNAALDGMTAARIRRHEIGHCNGWNATHDN